jgi:protein-tyrosine phosphatase
MLDVRPAHRAHTPDVDDPYYGGDAEFEEVFTVIEALPGLHAWVDEQLDRS